MRRDCGDDHLSLFSDDELERALVILGRPDSEIPRMVKDLRSYSADGLTIVSDDFWLAVASLSRDAADRVRTFTSLLADPGSEEGIAAT